MLKFAIIDAPSILGLKPTGVETLPQALRKAGLFKSLQAVYAGEVDVQPYNTERDKTTFILNPQSIKTFSIRLAEKVSEVLGKNQFPIVLGGDCSILIGCMLALRRSGKHGLFFIDGHADFYQTEAEPNGEVASMELAIISGRGPNILTDIDGLRPLVQDENIIAFGYRDRAEYLKYGSQDINETKINTFEIEKIKTLGSVNAAKQALKKFKENRLDGFWVHLDADVLDDKIMPAVDYRLPGGLHWDELSNVLKLLMASGPAVGLTITIFNPKLDSDGSIARRFSECIIAGLS